MHMRIQKIFLASLASFALSGCFSTARHVANVRPDVVKHYDGIKDKYRLARIILKKSSFSEFASKDMLVNLDKQESLLLRNRSELERKFVASPDEFGRYYLALNKKCKAFPHRKSAGYSAAYAVWYYNGMNHCPKDTSIGAKLLVEAELAMIKADRDNYKMVSYEDKKSGPNGTHAADTQLIFNAVERSLIEHYPSIMTKNPSAIPIAVVVDWATEYKANPDYSSIFSYWLWPNSATQESIYHIWVTTDTTRKSDAQLWQEYLCSSTPDAELIGKGAAVRESEVWETGLLPVGLIPVPGESDWPKTTTFMRAGKGSLVNNPNVKINSRNCFRDMVFEPAADGDVIAAAIMRTLNRYQRERDVSAIMMKGTAK